MFVAVLAGILLSPLLVLISALFRALFLFWPTMILLGAVHSYLLFVPALGWAATFFVVALLSLLVPSGPAAVSSSSSK